MYWVNMAVKGEWSKTGIEPRYDLSDKNVITTIQPSSLQSTPLNCLNCFTFHGV